MSYNGWTNYETWSVYLLIDNEQGCQDYWRKKGVYTDVYDLSQELKNKHIEANPIDGDNTIYSQLLSGALSEVNWYEVAEHIKDID